MLSIIFRIDFKWNQTLLCRNTKFYQVFAIFDYESLVFEKVDFYFWNVVNIKLLKKNFYDVQSDVSM